MNFGNNLRTWNLVCGAALVALVGCAVFDLVAPKLDQRQLFKKLDGERKSQDMKAQANEKLWADRNRKIVSSTWTDTVDVVSPKVLANLTDVAKASGVKLNNFRPGKPTKDGTVTYAVFDVNAAGTFNQVVDFIRKSEEPSQLLAVNSVQVNNSDGTTDSVSASISFVALLVPKSK
ncbi:MAG: hypothetical protein ABUL72_03110 [Armatimonadota bacterium]